MEEEAENQTDMQVILAQVMANLESTGIIKEFRVSNLILNLKFI